jgi:spermidine synthase
LLSGSAGLIHEVVWVRLLGLTFGTTSMAISTVLAAFMAGLALGSYWIGVRSERLRERQRIYALLEIGIGVYALLVPMLLDLTESLYAGMWRSSHFSFAALSLLRFMLAGALLLVPTVMMGATFPILAGYLSGLQQRSIAPQWLYTANLVGAVLGAGAAGYALMPAVGVWGTIVLGAALNIVVGVGVLALPSVVEQPAQSAPEALPSSHRAPPLLLGAAMLSGVMSLATQVAWTRVLVLVVGTTTYAFSAVLIVYLVALAIGSAWAARRSRRLTRVESDLAVMHALFALGTLAALHAVNRLPYWYLHLTAWWHPQSLAGIVAVKSALVFLVLCAPVVCAGTILPLALIGALPPSARGTGATVGRIYSANTVGAIMGAVLSSTLLMPLLGSRGMLLAVCAAAAVMAGVFSLAARSSWWVSAVTLLALFATALSGIRPPDWNYSELHAGVSEPGRVVGDFTETLTMEGEQRLYHREGPTASVLVAQAPDGTRGLFINARPNASDDLVDMATQVLLAQIPLLIAPRTDDVFIVGFGSGVTAGAATMSPAKQITVVEIEPAVVEASRYFLHVNRDPLRNPRVRLYEDDARHVLLASEDAYDVMISEPSHLWISGVVNLFTQDFYHLVRRRLRADGVFVQWLHIYRISPEIFRSIVATFQSVFPEVLVFQAPQALDIILVGSESPTVLDVDDLDRRWAADGTGEELARIGMRRSEHLLGSLVLGPEVVRTIARNGRINTDDNMFAEFLAPRDMVLESSDSGQRLGQALQQLATPIEQLVREPAIFLANRDRLEALIEGLDLARRPTERYRDLRATLD